ncbi:hypothetical protein BGZ73_001737 [Actinomortierella ambigua]|nr:hypothetical protein BGZ73_001737 [Actinomortierella ambigua]
MAEGRCVGSHERKDPQSEEIISPTNKPSVDGECDSEAPSERVASQSDQHHGDNSHQEHVKTNSSVNNKRKQYLDLSDEAIEALKRRKKERNWKRKQRKKEKMEGWKREAGLLPDTTPLTDSQQDDAVSPVPQKPLD